MSKAAKKTSDKTIKLEPATEAGKIWNEIKNKKIEMFALPDQIVEKYCHLISIEPSKLYVIPSAPSVLPALETALGSKYTVSLAEKYLIVARA